MIKKINDFSSVMMLTMFLGKRFSDNDLDVRRDDYREKFFLSSTMLEGPFMCRFSPKDRYSRCVCIQIIADGMHDPQILRMRSSDG
jgi:hypothetical protein